ncbi:MAG: hypothetical protein GY786_11505 [Proteobacteria bacterium]|nr:hypothetical protein [Pseudomonadota bacterium]
MHKEISKSVEVFILKTIPVISELDESRGDEFTFVPIIPKTIENETREEIVDKAPVAEVIEEKKYYGFTQQEWIYIAVLGLLLLIIIILLFKIRKISHGMNALQDMIENEDISGKTEEVAETIDTLHSTIQDRIKSQEEKVNDVMLEKENIQLSQEIVTKLVGRKDWCEELIEEFGQEKQGVEDFSRFVKILGATTARSIFAKVMGDQKYLELENMADDVDPDLHKDNELLKNIKKSLFTRELTSPEAHKSDPFRFLSDLSANQVGYIIDQEPAKIKAIVMSRLNSADVATILKRFSKTERADVVLQLGNLQEIPFEVLTQVAIQVAQKAQEVPSEDVAGFNGVNMLVDAISESDESVRRDIISNLRVSDRKLSEQVESRFFLFDSIPVVPNEVLTEVVRSLPAPEVINAITGCEKRLQEKVIICFPEKLRRTLVSSLKSQTPSIESIKSGRYKITQLVQQMADKGKIDLRKIAAAWEKANTQKAG